METFENIKVFRVHRGPPRGSPPGAWGPSAALGPQDSPGFLSRIALGSPWALPGSPTGPQATGKFAVLPSEEGPQISQNKTKIKQQLSDQQKKAWPHPSDQELRRAFSDQKNSSMTGLSSQASLCLSSRKRRTDYFSQVLATSFYSFCQLERQEKLLLIWQSGLHGLRLFCVYS